MEINIVWRNGSLQRLTGIDYVTTRPGDFGQTYLDVEAAGEERVYEPFQKVDFILIRGGD